MDQSGCRFLNVTNREEIELVSHLAREIWTEHYTPIIGTEQVQYMLENFQSVEAIEESIGQGMLYNIIFIESDPVGYYAVKPNEPIDKLFLSKIYVLASARGKGIASQAVKNIIETARINQLGYIWLTVNKNNKGSIAAYHKMGFRKTGSIVTPIGSGFVMDDDVMEMETDYHTAARQ